MQEIVSKFFDEFNYQKISVKYFLKLISENKPIIYHAFGCWNEIYLDNNEIIFCRRHGGTGERLEEYYRIGIEEMGAILFMPYQKGFLYFFKSSTRSASNSIEAKLVYEEVDTHLGVSNEQLFLEKQGIILTENRMSFDKDMRLFFNLVEFRSRKLITEN